MQIGNVSVIFGDGRGSNTYVIKDEKTCIVDPGFTVDFGIDMDKVDFVVNTHAHFDHIKNNYLFKNSKIYAHELDLPDINEGKNTCAELFGKKLLKVKAEKIPPSLNLGKTCWRVLHTPGHTRGSICLYEEKLGILISGDLVFADGYGRTDLYGGNKTQIAESLKNIAKLNIKHLLPGHGQLGDKKSVEYAMEMLDV